MVTRIIRSIFYSSFHKSHKNPIFVCVLLNIWCNWNLIFQLTDCRWLNYRYLCVIWQSMWTEISSIFGSWIFFFKLLRTKLRSCRNRSSLFIKTATTSFNETCQIYLPTFCIFFPPGCCWQLKKNSKLNWWENFRKRSELIGISKYITFFCYSRSSDKKYEIFS